jgi:hypothetical protein
MKSESIREFGSAKAESSARILEVDIRSTELRET